jgi:tRNA dimethylallyltransferase
MAEGKIIILQGPTGTGKSSLAEMLAEEYNGEIISADSRQVYRYLDIGTAKPDEVSQKKIKYHLIDIINPDEDCYGY